jgi:hypothetical protein
MHPVRPPGGRHVGEMTVADGAQSEKLRIHRMVLGKRMILDVERKNRMEEIGPLRETRGSG